MPWPRRAPADPSRELAQLQAFERTHELLREEHDLPNSVTRFHALPVIFLVLGLLLLTIDAPMLLVSLSLARALGLGCSTRSFGAALVRSIVVSIVSMLRGTFVPDSRRV